MKSVGLICLVLGLLSLSVTDQADTTKALPWASSAQAPTAFAVPIGKDTAVMVEAVALLDDWKNRDHQMYPMPIRTDTSSLIQTDDPTTLGLFGIKITDTHTAGVALITVETSGYEGRIFEVSQQRHDAEKRAHLLAYFLEQSAGVSTVPTPPTPVISPTLAMPLVASPLAASSFSPALDQLRGELANGQYQDALATIDALRAAVISRKDASGK
jgi:hypothetical protein